MGRTEKTIKNIVWSFAGKLITLVCSFLSRTVFILFLNETLLGVNGLYTEVLGLLSFAELGFGSAMSFSLYRPIAEGNDEKTYAILKYFKTVYRIIATVVLVVGISLMPFLKWIIHDAENITTWELKVYYLLFLINSVSSYFLSYKIAYVNAVQKSYLISNYDMILKIVTTILQILALLIFRSYLAYLLVQILASVLSKYLLSSYVDRRFSVFRLQTDAVIAPEDKKHILTEVKSLIVHQFASVAIYSTDNIIMTAVRDIGVAVVGYVSNYTMLISAVTGFTQLIFSNATFSFGNLAVSAEKDQLHNVFRQLDLIGFLVYGFVSICFYVLIPPFITLWIGEKYLIDSTSFLLIVLNCYMVGQTTVYHNARITRGEFARDKWMSFVQAMINLIVSIWAAQMFGLPGIYIGTVASRAFFLISRPMVTYRFIFGRPVMEYYRDVVVHLAVVLVIGMITNMVCRHILQEITILSFLLAAVTCALLSGGLLLISVSRTDVFCALLQRGKGMIQNVRNRT